MKMRSRALSQRVSLVLALALAAPLGIQALTQKRDPDDEKSAARATELIRQAIVARGGARYLGLKSLVSTGQYTPFDKGSSTVPSPFIDYIVYPDKERTEFGKGKKKDRRIQVNVGSTGWVYDGNTQTLKDQSQDQTRRFVEDLEYDLDRLLRGGWQEPGVEVRDGGREEVRPGERADVVEIRLKNGHRAFILLDGSTHLPAALTYERPEEKELIRSETRFFQYVTRDGVKFPNIVDSYRNGVQTARINFENIQLDALIDEALFAKPLSAKAVK